jgi:hypothetical protein
MVIMVRRGRCRGASLQIRGSGTPQASMIARMSFSW